MCYKCFILTFIHLFQLHVHPNNDNWESLHKSLSPELLPEEYGGKVIRSDLVDLVTEVISSEDYFKDQLKYGFDKMKKPWMLPSILIFGIAWSIYVSIFRKGIKSVFILQTQGFSNRSNVYIMDECFCMEFIWRYWSLLLLTYHIFGIIAFWW